MLLLKARLKIKPGGGWGAPYLREGPKALKVGDLSSLAVFINISKHAVVCTGAK